MRLRIVIFTAALILYATSPAVAAPTCWSAAGETVRCGAANALPVGAVLTSAQASARDGKSGSLGAVALLGLASVLGGLFALLALMPDFEGFERHE